MKPVPGFVGRRDELGLLDDLLAGEPVAPVVFVHGPGGIGKSALVREVVRRAQPRGLSVRMLDGRDTAAAQEDAPRLVAGIEDDATVLIVVDAYEHVAAFGDLLRSELSGRVGPGVRVLIAGRQPPEPGWLGGGWEHVLRVLPLRPLRPDEAQLLLEQRGLDDPGAIAEIVRWADGLPLGLGIAADAVQAGAPLDLGRLDADAALAEALMLRLAGAELEGADREVMAVAAVARAVDARLLAAVLPGVDADHAEAWLRSRSFAEPLGVRVTLHERVRKAVRGALVARDPEFERDLRRRIADYTFRRAVLGELWLLPDLAEMIDDPAVRWGTSPSSHARTHRASAPAPGDADAVAALLGAEGSDWWPATRRWFDEAPDHVMVVRDAAGAIAAVTIAVTPESAPDWAAEDRVLAPWLADARSRFPDGDALVLRDALDLAGELQSSAVAVGNTAVVLGSGLPTVRAIYMGLFDESHHQREFLRALDWSIVDELEVADADRTVRCYRNDFGTGGILWFTLKLVYRDLGMQPPVRRPAATANTETVRNALRSFHDPRALAASPLARGGTADQRAESVRRLLRDTVEEAFGDSHDEKLLRAVVERAYFEPSGGHDVAMEELHMSRTTHFRRLRIAVDRVARRVLDSRA